MSSQQPTARLRPFRPVPFGRYTLLAQLATGGMGEIFLARLDGAQGFEKFCVIKKILPTLSSDRAFVDRFVNEAKVLVKLSHGSIAQVLDMGLHEGDPYIALELVDGKDLRRVAARMRDRQLPPPLTFVLYVMSRVLDALAYAHRKRDDEDRELNLVHRDISPQNLLVSYEGEVKVIDFGLAKSTLSQAKTNPSIILGKFLYMSPEQARHQKVDRRSDLYAAGLCLYELIAGKNPFEDVLPGELMNRVANPTIPPLSSIDPLCPSAVSQVVMKALSVDPAQRFQTAEEMRGRVLSALLEIDPSAGPETVSRFMRETFAAEYQAERKQLAGLRDSGRTDGRALEARGHKDALGETGVHDLEAVRARTAGLSGTAAPGAPARTPSPQPAPIAFHRKSAPATARAPEPRPPDRSDAAATIVDPDAAFGLEQLLRKRNQETQPAVILGELLPSDPKLPAKMPAPSAAEGKTAEMPMLGGASEGKTVEVPARPMLDPARTALELPARPLGQVPARPLKELPARPLLDDVKTAELPARTMLELAKTAELPARMPEKKADSPLLKPSPAPSASPSPTTPGPRLRSAVMNAAREEQPTPVLFASTRDGSGPRSRLLFAVPALLLTVGVAGYLLRDLQRQGVFSHREPDRGIAATPAPASAAKAAPATQAANSAARSTEPSPEPSPAPSMGTADEEDPLTPLAPGKANSHPAKGAKRGSSRHSASGWLREWGRVKASFDEVSRHEGGCSIGSMKLLCSRYERLKTEVVAADGDPAAQSRLQARIDSFTAALRAKKAEQ